MKKVLFVATVTGHINAFHIPYLKWFKEHGYEVHVASNGEKPIEYCDKHFNLPFERFPLKINNLQAYKMLKKIINENKYKIVHCHTPVGGVLTRLSAKNARKNGTKVIYTAHGFHFYKGAPLLNWILYYPVEKYLSKFTDCIITINNEDYKLASKKFKAKKIEKVNGIGVDEKKYKIEITKEEKSKMRKKLNIAEDDFVILTVGELNDNKNQVMAIKTMERITLQNNKIKLLIAGTGNNENKYKEMIKEYKIENNVSLIGYRNDINKLMKISDLLISTSKREGLPVNIMEAMISGLPIIATNCRGNRDLIENNNNGYIVDIDDTNTLEEKIIFLKNNKKEADSMKEKNEQIIKPYLIDNVMKTMKGIYSDL